ncbi:MAG: hypothetical protein ACOCQS_00575, partial [Bacillota bacterium]
MRKLIIIFLLCLFFLSFPLLQNKINASERLTIETDNFIINFEKENTDISTKIAEIAEEVHKNLVPFMDYQPENKTHIIVNDNLDMANGSTNVSYFNRINLYLRHPQVYSGMVGYYENWLKLLITHEYTHVLHLDMNTGDFGAYRKLLGKIPLLSTPNMLQPWWMIEGYTTYLESKYTKGGRGNNDIYPMYLRTQFTEKNVYDIDQIHGRYNIENWPPTGESIYIYGLSLFEYISEKYGEEKLTELSHRFSSNPKIGINNVFKQVLGTNINDLYENWKQEMENQVSSKKNRIDRENINKVEQLTNTGGYNRSIAVSPENNDFVYLHYGNMFSSLRLFKEKKEDKQLFPLINPEGERISWSDDGQKLLYSKLEYYNKSFLNYDIYTYDFQNNKEQRLTRGERAYSPVWKGDQNILYLVQKNNKTYLKKKNINNDEVSILLEVDSNKLNLSHLSMSPDDDELLLSLWKNGKRDIYKFNLSEKKLIPLIEDKHINIYPQWSPEGEYIIFSSDRNGSFNLYAYDLDKSDLFQVTNLFTGAFEAKFLNNKEIIFTGYSGNGYNIYKVPFKPESREIIEEKQYSSGEELKIKNIDTDLKSEISSEKNDYNINKYKPLSTLKPRYWIPAFSYQRYNNNSRLRTGITTGGIDALNKHQYQVEVLYDNLYPIPQLEFKYQYNDENIPLTSSLSLENDFDKISGETINIQNYRTELTYPLVRNYFSEIDLSMDLKYKYRDNITRNNVIKSALGFGTGINFQKVSG